MKPDGKTLAQWAVQYAKRGLYIFPVTPGQRAPPLVPAWQNLANKNVETITGWWEHHPKANIGCHVGASGHVVLDIDVKNGKDGFATMRALEMDHGLDLPGTGWQVETPSGGLHIWYTLPPGMIVGNSVEKIGPGVDVRSMNGYVLLPPSKIYDMENIYTWLPPQKFPIATGS